MEFDALDGWPEDFLRPEDRTMLDKASIVGKNVTEGQAFITLEMIDRAIHCMDEPPNDPDTARKAHRKIHVDGYRTA